LKKIIARIIAKLLRSTIYRLFLVQKKDMTIKRTLFIALIWLAQFGFSQFNDTLFYDSGDFKVVEIIDKSKKEITYQFINETGDITAASTPIFTLTHYVCYDTDNVMQYYVNVKSNSEAENTRDISKSSVTLTPFSLNMPGIGISYNLTFGEKMRWKWSNRFHFPAIGFIYGEPFQSLMYTMSIHYVPVYRKKFRWSIGLNPTVLEFLTFKANFAAVYLPISNSFEFKLKGDWSIEATASIGAYYFVYGNNFHHFPIPSLDVGFIKTFGKTRKIPLGDNKMQ
jgi:hypothetical protein